MSPPSSSAVVEGVFFPFLFLFSFFFFFLMKTEAVCQIQVMVSNYKDTKRVKTKQNNQGRGLGE